MALDVHLVQTTLPSSWIEAFVGEFKINLLHAGAACVEHQSVHSMYSWEGEVQSQQEWKVTATVSQPFLEGLIQAIPRQHPYETPQIFTWGIDANTAYCEWAHQSGLEHLQKV